MKLVEDVGFDSAFSFIYSPRPGTPAAALPDDTPPAVKLERLQRLQARVAGACAHESAPRDGRHAPARAGRRPSQEAMPASSAAVPRTTAS